MCLRTKRNGGHKCAKKICYRQRTVLQHQRAHGFDSYQRQSKPCSRIQIEAVRCSCPTTIGLQLIGKHGWLQIRKSIRLSIFGIICATRTGSQNKGCVTRSKNTHKRLNSIIRQPASQPTKFCFPPFLSLVVLVFGYWEKQRAGQAKFYNL